jgi:hypothetical protein
MSLLHPRINACANSHHQEMFVKSETCCRTSRLMLPDWEPPLTTVAPVSWSCNIIFLVLFMVLYYMKPLTFHCAAKALARQLTHSPTIGSKPSTINTSWKSHSLDQFTSAHPALSPHHLLQTPKSNSRLPIYTVYPLTRHSSHNQHATLSTSP